MLGHKMRRMHHPSQAIRRSRKARSPSRTSKRYATGWSALLIAFFMALVACGPQFPAIEKDGVLFEISCSVVAEQRLDTTSEFTFDSGEDGLAIDGVDPTEALALHARKLDCSDLQGWNWVAVYRTDLTKERRGEVEQMVKG